MRLEDMARMGSLELQLWQELGERILLGQKRYGKLRKRKKNWRKELHEELLDVAFYTMMEEISVRKSKARAKARRKKA